jgi:hypothetical protein
MDTKDRWLRRMALDRDVVAATSSLINKDRLVSQRHLFKKAAMRLPEIVRRLKELGFVGGGLVQVRRPIYPETWVAFGDAASEVGLDRQQLVRLAVRLELGLGGKP